MDEWKAVENDNVSGVPIRFPPNTHGSIQPIMIYLRWKCWCLDYHEKRFVDSVTCRSDGRGINEFPLHRCRPGDVWWNDMVYFCMEDLNMSTKTTRPRGQRLYLGTMQTFLF